MRQTTKMLIAVLMPTVANAASASDMGDMEKAKSELYRCVERQIPLVDDGISAPEKIGAAAAQLCPDEINAAMLAADKAIGAGADDGVREVVQKGTAFAPLVLMRRVALHRHRKQ